jgi:hypothetical protein
MAKGVVEDRGTSSKLAKTVWLLHHSTCLVLWLDIFIHLFSATSPPSFSFFFLYCTYFVIL